MKQKQYPLKSHHPFTSITQSQTHYIPQKQYSRGFTLANIHKGCTSCFQRKISVTPVDNFQPCAAHSNSPVIPHILLTVNGMQNSIQPCLQISQQDVIAVYQLLGVGFLLHQLVCLPRNEMKISPRREPNIIASCLVSFHGRPVAAFASSTTGCVSTTKAAEGWDLAVFSSVMQPRQFPELCPRALSVWSLVALPPGVHLRVSRQDEPRFPFPWLTRSPWPC